MSTPVTSSNIVKSLPYNGVTPSNCSPSNALQIAAAKSLNPLVRLFMQTSSSELPPLLDPTKIVKPLLQYNGTTPFDCSASKVLQVVAQKPINSLVELLMQHNPPSPQTSSHDQVQVRKREGKRLLSVHLHSLGNTSSLSESLAYASIAYMQRISTDNLARLKILKSGIRAKVIDPAFLDTLSTGVFYSQEYALLLNNILQLIGARVFMTLGSMRKARLPL